MQDDITGMQLMRQVMYSDEFIYCGQLVLLDSIVSNRTIIDEALDSIEKATETDIPKIVRSFYTQYLQGKRIVVKKFCGENYVKILFGNQFKNHMLRVVGQHKNNLQQKREVAKQMIIAISKIGEIFANGKQFPTDSTVSNFHLDRDENVRRATFGYVIDHQEGCGRFGVAVSVKLPYRDPVPIGYSVNISSSRDYKLTLQMIQKTTGEVILDFC